ncbi:MAG: GntR family transcriptional regulator [Woeseia sp.]
MPNRNVAGGHGDRVYRAIKARAVAFGFGPGERIRLGLLAAQLGVSTTPIRAALNMLVAEGLVTREPRKGFVAMSMSEDRFIGLYRLNQHLLDAALTVRRSNTEVVAAAAPTVASIGNALDGSERNTPDAIADYTGLLFSCIAQLSANAHVVESVEHINDSLRYVRTLEHEQLNDVPGELIRICELFLAERFNEVAEAIAEYHTCRLALLPKLLAALRK